MTPRLPGYSRTVASLAPEAVLPLLRGAFGRPYRYAAECPSTQELLRCDDPEGAVAAADHQTAGRGRSGRTWLDEPGEALLCSVLLRPPPGPELPQLSLAVALAAAEAVERATGLEAQVKWPNDVLLDGRKVAGILLEAHDGAVVCGVGVNVNQRAESLPQPMRPPAASLRTATGRGHDRASLLADLLDRLERAYATWSRGGLAPLLPDLESRNALLGLALRSSAGEGVGGRIAGDGRLEVILEDSSVRLVESGEVELL